MLEPHKNLRLHYNAPNCRRLVEFFACRLKTWSRGIAPSSEGSEYTAHSQERSRVAHLDRRTFLATTASAAIGTAAEDTRPYPGTLYDIYPVPPLARTNDAKRSINLDRKSVV